MEPYLIVILSLIGLLIIVFLIQLYRIYRITFKNKQKPLIDDYYYLEHHYYDPYRDFIKQGIEDIRKLKYQELWLESHNNYKLYGRYYHYYDNAPVILFAHGFRSTGIRDFVVAIPTLIKEGYNILVIDQRGHGKSDGNKLCFGELERFDILEWTKKIIELEGKDVKIFLFGLSMGAGSVLMAESLDLPANVCGIIADSAYSTPIETIREVAQYQLHVHKVIAGWMVYLAALLFAHFNLNKTDCLRAIKDKHIPILLIQGDKDRLVPMWMCKEVVEAGGPMIQLEVFKETGHMLSSLKETERYQKLIIDFCKKWSEEDETQSK